MLNQHLMQALSDASLTLMVERCGRFAPSCAPAWDQTFSAAWRAVLREDLLRLGAELMLTEPHCGRAAMPSVEAFRVFAAGEFKCSALSWTESRRRRP